MNRDHEDDLPPNVTDNGIRYSNIGNFMPEGTYRPIPIVWLVAAWTLQGVSQIFIFLVLMNKAAMFTVLATALVGLAIGRWTFERGMKHAGAGWCVATVIVLLGNWSLLTLVALSR